MSFATFAQITRVSGVITDAKTNQTLPFVNVFAADSSVNITADEEGKYTLTSRPDKPFSQIKVSFVGYKPTIINVKSGQDQIINIKLVKYLRIR